MMDKKINHLLEKIFNKKNRKEMINTLISLVVVFALLLFLYNTIFSDSSMERKNIDLLDQTEEKGLEETMISNDEVRLERILSQISGVGKVDVMITYETGKEIIPAFDVQENNEKREERDATGRIILNSSQDSSRSIVTVNNEDLLVLKEIKPRVKGVIIVAEGAGNLVIRNNIINAASAIFDIPVDRIVVFEKNHSMEGSAIYE